MSDSVRLHRRQPTRLPLPWESPGKNTGVGCHFLLQCMKVKSLSCVRLLVTHGLQPTRLLHPWDFPGKSTGVGCHCLLCSNDYLQSISFRIDWLDLLSVQGTLKHLQFGSSPAPQFESINPSMLSLLLWSSSHIYLTTGKIIALTILTFLTK